ncbi:hypothetical protein DRO24_03675 [Candidatus Bathyarchaeota archaeon]|nr:MAG: hypothetical protein DRO24_03675 [Candidatus Bathyarchaeota archaeon]
MVSEEAIRGIPGGIRGELATRLVDLLLEAKEGVKLPSSKAKRLLQLWSLGELLESDEGLELLLEGAAAVDPEGLRGILDEYGLERLKGEVLG